MSRKKITGSDPSRPASLRSTTGRGRQKVSRKTLGASGATKADLIDAVYSRHGGLTKREAGEVVDAIFSVVKTTLGDGRPVKIKNFGSFVVQDRAGRMGVNPASGKKMFIEPHKGLSFRPARRLRDMVDDEDA